MRVFGARGPQALDVQVMTAEELAHFLSADITARPLTEVFWW